MSQDMITTPEANKITAAGMTVKDGVLHGKNGTPIGKVSTETSLAKPKTPPKSKPTATKTPKAAQTKPNVRSVGETDMSPAQRRLTVIKMMRKVGAISATTSITAEQLASKTGLTKFDVYGQLYHANPLQRNGFIKQVQVESVRGLAYHLTAKGQKTDPS